MSELQPVVGQTLPAPAETRSAEMAASRQTFWAVVGRAFWRSLMNRVATVWLVGIVGLTILVPFLANDAPFTGEIKHIGDDGAVTWVRQYPLLHDMTRVDWVWITWGLAIMTYLAAHVRTGKRNIEIEELRFLRMKWGAAVAGVALLLTLGVVVLKKDFLDTRLNVYRTMEKSGEMRSAVFPPLRWGYAAQEPLEANRLYERPSADHVLGTDSNGRDVLARLMWGARVVLEIGLISELIAMVIGIFYGAMMGYFVGRVDMLGMRILEIIEAIPLLFLLLTFVALFGRHLFMIMVIIGLVSWTGIARFVRAEFLRIRQADYVSAAKALGLPLRNVLFKHMMPNGLTPVIVSVTFGVAGNIVSESILSFLGIGVEPPTASWGVMLYEAGNPGEVFRWWLALAPGLLIFLTVFAYNVIGEGLRDAIDPKTNKIE